MTYKKINYSLKLNKNGQNGQLVRTHSKRRFLNYLRSINWQKGQIKAYIKVNYGKEKDVFGKLTTFYNDGTYENEHDLQKAFIAFTED